MNEATSSLTRAARLPQRFAEHTLALGRSVLRVWSQCCAQANLAGQRLATLDALLMATAPNATG